MAEKERPALGGSYKRERGKAAPVLVARTAEAAAAQEVKRAVSPPVNGGEAAAKPKPGTGAKEA